MRLSYISLKNFRSYEDASVSFDPDYTVLIGVNGAGKTSLLRACSIALGAFVGAMDKADQNSIAAADARITTKSLGSRMETEQHFPVSVFAEAIFHDNHSISWSRSLNGIGLSTTVAGSRLIREYAQELLDSNEQGEDKILDYPLIAYYGTNRLSRQTYSVSRTSKTKGWKRTDGYSNCLDVQKNQEQMVRWFRDMTLQELENNEKVPELTAVENAISLCCKGGDSSIKSAYIRYSVKDNELMMYTRRDTDPQLEKLPVSSLSGGERNILFVVADIAYRMALLNPQKLEDVLSTSGVVLIDEIDLHLHPKWQKTILDDLKRSFPNVQFIVTTHSPSIIANVSNEHIRVLQDHKILPLDKKTFGRNLNDILLDIMGVEVQPAEVMKLQHGFDDALTKNEYDKAREYLDKMSSLMGENSTEVINNRIAYDGETMNGDLDS